VDTLNGNKWIGVISISGAVVTHDLFNGMVKVDLMIPVFNDATFAITVDYSHLWG
jgi:hypothetical protein